MGLAAVPCSGRVGAEIGTDDAWPVNLMCRLLLPVPVKELAAIGDALAKIAKKQGKEARMKQVGQTLEIFTVQNAELSHAGAGRRELQTQARSRRCAPVIC